VHRWQLEQESWDLLRRGCTHLSAHGLLQLGTVYFEAVLAVLHERSRNRGLCLFERHGCTDECRLAPLTGKTSATKRDKDRENSSIAVPEA
jgi:hypothetical protein